MCLIETLFEHETDFLTEEIINYSEEEIKEMEEEEQFLRTNGFIV